MSGGADDDRRQLARRLERELDAEARLSGQRWVMVAVVVAVAMLMGCLSASNEVSRAVARWEVSDGE